MNIRTPATLLLFLAPLREAAAVTAIAFTSAPDSWIGGGESRRITAENPDYNFRLEPTGSAVLILWVGTRNSPGEPDFDPATGEPYDWWTIELAAPGGSILGVGRYDHASRYRFQEPTRPGLNFMGNHRGNNMLSGFFDILEIGFDSEGNISRIAADFTQYDEMNPAAWVRGQVRYNSTVPVPEPVTSLIGAVALIPALRRRPRPAPAAQTG